MLSAFISSLRTADLRRKILLTLGIVILYRVGATLPSPGVNYHNVRQCIDQVSGGSGAQLYSLINLFSGGALLQLTVFAVGVMPYITASIIVQLLTVVIPRFEQLRKEGQAGQNKMTQYTRYLSVALSILQATSIVALAANGGLLQGCNLDIISDQSIFALVLIVLVRTAGAALVAYWRFRAPGEPTSPASVACFTSASMKKSELAAVVFSAWMAMTLVPATRFTVPAEMGGSESVMTGSGAFTAREL